MTKAWREAPIDDGRLARAVTMRVERGEDGAYGVAATGREPELHWVNVAATDTPLCDCGDHTFREVLCAHALAVLLYEGDRRAVQALGQLIRGAWLDRKLVLMITKRSLAPLETLEE